MGRVIWITHKYGQKNIESMYQSIK